MTDLFLLVGTALLALSVILAVASLARTEPPRSAAIMFVFGLALELAGQVSVNVVSPGVIETSVSQPVHDIPAGRVGTVQEIVDTVMFFVRASPYITGQEIEVAGGWNL